MKRFIQYVFTAVLISTLVFAVGCGSDEGDEETNETPQGGEQSFATDLLNQPIKTTAVVDSFVNSAAAAKKETVTGIVLDPSKTAKENADAVKAALKNSVGNATCLTITAGATEVEFTAVFISSCKIVQAGVNVEGTIKVSVAVAGNNVTATLQLTNVTLDGQGPLNGTASVSYSGSATYSVAINTTTSSAVFNFAGSYALTNKIATINGTGDYTKNAVMYAFTLNNVTWKVGECYPNGGSVEIKINRLTETLAFNAQTPTTGKATLTVGRKSQEVTLLAYGSCPPAK